MAAITSTGVGSGIDVAGLVSSLVAAEGASKSARLDAREAKYAAQLSSLGTLKGTVSEFQGSYSALKSVSTFNALTATSSNDEVFTVSATKDAVAGSYDIDVTQLAVAQRLQTASGYPDNNITSIGTGTLTFSFASDLATTFDVTISDGTLQDIRDSINDADIGVKANVVFDGTEFQLVMTSQTGTDNALTITQTSTTGDLSNFSTGSLTQTVAPLDAALTVDGVIITSASNTLSNIIEDVTIDLVGTGTTETLTLAKDTSAVGAAVQGFVDGYNALITATNAATAYSEEGASGILIGDSTVRSIVSQLRGILNTTVGDVNTQYNSLASIGILTARDGTLEYDVSKLTAALSAKPEEVQQLLAGGRATVNSSEVTVKSIPDDLASGNYAFSIDTYPTDSTIGGIAATNTGITFSGTDTLDGFELEYTGASTGTIASVTVEDGLMDNLDTLINSFLASDGYITSKTDGLNSSIADIADARVRLNERLASYESRLLKQFNAMDSIVAKLNTTSTFLTNQLGSLNSLANNRNN